MPVKERLPVCVCVEYNASSLWCSLETSLSHKAYYYDDGTENSSFSKTSLLEWPLIFGSSAEVRGGRGNKCTGTE